MFTYVIKNLSSYIPKDMHKSEFDLLRHLGNVLPVAFQTSIFRYTWRHIISDRKHNIFEVALFANLTFYCIMLNSTKEVTNITSINHAVAYLRRQNEITWNHLHTRTLSPLWRICLRVIIGSLKKDAMPNTCPSSRVTTLISYRHFVILIIQL